jgi:hypothetical protein
MGHKYIPRKRHQIATLSLQDKIDKAKNAPAPSRHDLMWVPAYAVNLYRTSVCWIKTTTSIKLAIFFKAPPHWYALDAPNPFKMDEVLSYILVD